MTFRNAIIGASLLTCASFAFATPQYSGTTTSNGPLALNQGAGYYLWNDESNTSNWSLRWTGTGADHDPVEWFGKLVFQNQSLNTYSEILFENGGTYGDVLTYSSDFTDEELVWSAATNNTGGIDGFDFSLSSNLELMQFSLGSSIYSDLEVHIDDQGVASTGLFIGDGYASTNVLVFSSNAGKYQQFEIKVPEPGTLALLGLGLAGLGAARRRQKA